MTPKEIAEELNKIAAVIREGDIDKISEAIESFSAKVPGDMTDEEAWAALIKECDRTFIIHWRDGTKSEIVGRTIERAFTKAGYGHGAIKAIDYYEEKKEEDHGA